MKKQLINFETLLMITKAMSVSRDPEEAVFLIVKSIRTALDIKGCTLFLLNPKSDELEVAASYGLSKEYLNKGSVSSLHSIAQSLHLGPVAIYDVTDDPRIQYPEAAKDEGIASVLSVPVVVRGIAIGAMRFYTSRPWEFTLEEVNFVQALTQMAGMLIDMCRLSEGKKEMIDVLTKIRDTSSV
jgi:signal transduction protein with GAF and PtsI domain